TRLEAASVLGRSRRSFVVNLGRALALGLVVSGCSGAAPSPAAPATATGPTASGGQSANAPTATAAQSGGATVGAATAQPTSAAGAATAPQTASGGQPEQRSVQAGGDPGGPVSDAPAAPVVARSRTTGRPITLEIWLTDWEQSTQQFFNDQLVPAFE